jgi:hypothetical protein
VGRDESIQRAIVWRGIYDNGSYTWHAYNLNDVIIDHCPDVLGDFTLTWAVAVNNAGWIIAHDGTDPYVNRSFILVPLGIDGNGHGCLGDVNLDGVVDVSDLLALLAAWGPCPEEPCPPLDCPADLNHDGVVDVSDLLILLANWGPCPEFPARDQPTLSHEQVVLDAGLTMNDWDDFMTVMINEGDVYTPEQQQNWRCWMEHYLGPCQRCSSTCAGADPFAD